MLSYEESINELRNLKSFTLGRKHHYGYQVTKLFDNRLRYLIANAESHVSKTMIVDYPVCGFIKIPNFKEAVNSYVDRVLQDLSEPIYSEYDTRVHSQYEQYGL